MIIASSRTACRHLLPLRSRLFPFSTARMVQNISAKANLSHEERTATEPRNEGLHTVVLDKITPVNSQIKTYRFTIKDPRGMKFLPGQWLDVHVPGIDKAGGFTITSPPCYAVPLAAEPASKPYLELAIQKSPDNPPAAWLWQPSEAILGKELVMRVGGSFVWPPSGVKDDEIKRVVFIAGGVGINPLISMLAHIRQECPDLQVHFIYSTKLPSKDPNTSEILFLPQILGHLRIPQMPRPQTHLELFFTGTWDGSQLSIEDDFIQSLQALPNIDGRTVLPVSVRTDRIDEASLTRAVGTQNERQSSAYYVCGPPEMTDSIVDFLRKQDGVVPERVLCEKWW